MQKYTGIFALVFAISFNVNSQEIGDIYQGGIIFQINEDGTGLVADLLDLGQMNWYEAIVATSNSTSQGYDDWYLPDLYELFDMYNNIGPGSSNYDASWNVSSADSSWYWSTFEYGNGLQAFAVSGFSPFPGGYFWFDKTETHNVRAIRSVIFDSVFDECGVAFGDNSTCTDCAGILNGTSEDLGCGCGVPAALEGYDCEGNFSPEVGDYILGGIVFKVNEDNTCKVADLQDLVGSHISGGMNWNDAIDAAENSTSQGFDDWYLPSMYELELLFNTAVNIGGDFLDGFYSYRYWSSEELNSTHALDFNFGSGYPGTSWKSAIYPVRAIRSGTISSEDACGVPNGDNSSCLDECGVPNGDNSTCADECGVPNGDNSTCLDCAGVPNGDNSCVDECGIPNGDNSTCIDECGVPNGDNSTCLDCAGIVNGTSEDLGCGCGVPGPIVGYDCEGNPLQIGDITGGGIIFQINDDGTAWVADLQDFEYSNWNDALNIAESANSQGYDDWQIPSEDEILAMYWNIGPGDPYSNFNFCNLGNLPQLDPNFSDTYYTYRKIVSVCCTWNWNNTQEINFDVLVPLQLNFESVETVWNGSTWETISIPESNTVDLNYPSTESQANNLKLQPGRLRLIRLAIFGLDENTVVYTSASDNTADNFLDLPEGWSMFGYSCLESQDVTNAFSDISTKISIVKDDLGQAYLPEWNFSAFDNLEFGEGYQIKMLEEVTDFEFCESLVLEDQISVSEYLANNYYLDLPEGWSMFGYTCSYSQDVTDAFSDISTKISLVKNELGQVYLPEWNFSAFDNLEFGKGYQIKMIEEVTDFQFCEPLDICGVPNGDNSTCLDLCGVPFGDNSTCLDCAGIINGPLEDLGCGCGNPAAQEGYDCEGNFSPEVGDYIEGGIVFQVNEDGSGLVANLEQLGEMDWYDAFNAAENLISQGYDDWYLPSLYELDLMHYSAVINGFIDTLVVDDNADSERYWSNSTSIEVSTLLNYYNLGIFDDETAWCVDFKTSECMNTVNSSPLPGYYRVRAIRSISF